MRRAAPHYKEVLKSWALSWTPGKGREQTENKPGTWASFKVTYSSFSWGAEEPVAEVICPTPEHKLRSRTDKARTEEGQ